MQKPVFIGIGRKQYDGIQSKPVGYAFVPRFEDKIILDYNENPLLIDGMRRDVMRVARHMEYYFRQVGGNKQAPDYNQSKNHKRKVE